MDEATYQQLINEPDVLDHTTLNVTLKEVVARQEYTLAAELQRILKDNKIEKPALSADLYDARPTYYKVELEEDTIDKIVDILFDLEAEFNNDEGEPTPTSAFYASLVDKWLSLSRNY
jgi:hypothetical protein